VAERAARAHQLALSAYEIRAELSDLSHLWLREAHLAGLVHRLKENNKNARVRSAPPQLTNNCACA